MSDPKRPPPEKKARRPYEKPQIRTEEVFERAALSCQGKTASCEMPPFSFQGS